MNCPLLIKFGKREHLEQLKNGIVHFSKLEVFQMDPTAYRGDRMEGKDYLDPSKPLLINGLDISPYLKEATISHEFEDTNPDSLQIVILIWRNAVHDV